MIELNLKFDVSLCPYFLYTVYSCTLYSQGRVQEFVQGGLKFCFSFQGAQHPLGPENPPEINRFHWSRGAFPPQPPPPEYASVYVSVSYLLFILLRLFNCVEPTYFITKTIQPETVQTLEMKTLEFKILISALCVIPCIACQIRQCSLLFLILTCINR